MRFFKFVKWLIWQVEPHVYFMIYLILFLLSFGLGAILSSFVPILIVGGLAVVAIICALIYIVYAWVKEQWSKFNAQENEEAERIVKKLQGLSR